MTRVKFFWAVRADVLTDDVNLFIEAAEADDYGIKTVEYGFHPAQIPEEVSGWSAMVVYGNGPTTIQRWGGRPQ